MSIFHDPSLRRIYLISMITLLILVIWQFLPLLEQQLVRMTAEPRVVTSRGDLAAQEKSTIEVFEQASPSVVFISTRQRVVDFWTRDVLNVERGTGSGFLWDELGHVVTNKHVIDNASQAQVRLNDGRSFDAVLVGYSADHDIAVLRISVPFDLPPPLPIGTSNDLRVGQTTLAIGNPFGLDYSLTTGVVSALNRSIQEASGRTIEQLIQTDAAINPGNSGGPLLDSAGRLIGINTAIFSPSGAYAGIGFAVPVDTVNRVVPQLIAQGRYVRPKLGIGVDQDINRQVSLKLGQTGVVVLRVDPDSAAFKAGLRPTRIDANGEIIAGDIIQSIDEHDVEDVNELLTTLERYAVGDRVTLTVWRLGKLEKIDLILQ